MGCGSSSSARYSSVRSYSQTSDEEMDEERISNHSQETTGELNLKQFIIPANVTYVKTGNTLCSNGKVVVFQNGSTTVDFRIAPRFQPKKINWRYGLVRDIVWCAELHVFLLLTRDRLYTINPDALFLPETAHKPLVDLTVNVYGPIKPGVVHKSFWRCTCVGKTVYIIYAGYPAIIDQYSLETNSCRLVKRFIPPKTDNIDESIRCIRYQPKTDQLGFAIIDSASNQWRFEVRDRKTFARLWHKKLPFTEGECEISPLPNGDWLAVNSRGTNLIQIANHTLKPAIDYDRELKNAVVMNNLYFAVRTKNTIDIRRVKRPKIINKFK